MNFLATGVRPEKRTALKVSGTERSRNEVEKAAQNRTLAKEDIIEEKPEEEH